MLYPNEWQLTMWHKCLDWLFFPRTLLHLLPHPCRIVYLVLFFEFRPSEHRVALLGYLFGDPADKYHSAESPLPTVPQRDLPHMLHLSRHPLRHDGKAPFSRGTSVLNQFLINFVFIGLKPNEIPVPHDLHYT